MENFTVDQLNEFVNYNYQNEIEFTSHNFRQTNASNEAVYFVETTTNLVGLIYVTDRGEDRTARYTISTDSLMTSEAQNTVTSDAQAQTRADESGGTPTTMSE